MIANGQGIFGEQPRDGSTNKVATLNGTVVHHGAGNDATAMNSLCGETNNNIYTMNEIPQTLAKYF